MVRKINTINKNIKTLKAVLVTSDVNMIKTGTLNMSWFRKYLSKTKRLQ